MLLKSLVFSLVVNLFFSRCVNSATFENVTVLLTIQKFKSFFPAYAPMLQMIITSSDTLDQHINTYPFETLRIQNANIPQLPENSVSNLPYVQHISIISSGIKDIQPGAFKNLNLEGLNLEGNSIEEIKDGVFTGLSVKYLYLNNNKISKIENGAFNNMSMALISLNDNQISTWCSCWFIGTPVGSIYMTNNLLEELPGDAFDYALEFKRINTPLVIPNLVLSQNKISRIDENAFNHVNGFNYLNLAGNLIEKLPEEVFKTVKNIHTLDLTDNLIENVDGVFDDINIHQLILINNTLECFPVEAFDVSRINYVFLDRNPLSCQCVGLWQQIQIQHGVWVVYNIQNLVKNCTETIKEDSPKAV